MEHLLQLAAIDLTKYQEEGFNPYFYGTSTSTSRHWGGFVAPMMRFNPYFYGTSTSTNRDAS